MFVGQWQGRKYGFLEVTRGNTLIHFDNPITGSRLSMGIPQGLRGRLATSDTNAKDILTRVFFQIMGALNMHGRVNFDELLSSFRILYIKESALGTNKAKNNIISSSQNRINPSNIRFVYSEDKIWAYSELVTSITSKEAIVTASLGSIKSHWKLVVTIDGDMSRVIASILTDFFYINGDKPYITYQLLEQYITNTLYMNKIEAKNYSIKLVKG